MRKAAWLFTFLTCVFGLLALSNEPIGGCVLIGAALISCSILAR